MRELNEHEIKCAAGGQDYGREIAQGAGAAAGTFVAGGGGAIVGPIVAGMVYDWVSNKTPDSALSPSGLGSTLKQKPEGLPSEAWNYAEGRMCNWSPNNLNDVCK